MRISDKFAELKKGEKALILYISCGDPSAAATVKAAKEVIAAGCDVLELGLPFSDPIADGPTIQAASQRAIAAGMNTDKYFETAKKIAAAPEAKSAGGIPLVCMTYYNLIYQYGLERFAKSCAASGITGLIVPDLPPEEAMPLKEACLKSGVDLIFIVSPMTSRERMKNVAKAAFGCRGFVYLQSVLGVTGAREGMKTDLASKIKEIKAAFGLPVAVGFGVSKPEQVKELVGQGADGVIIGSALVAKIAKKEDVSGYVKGLKKAAV